MKPITRMRIRSLFPAIVLVFAMFIGSGFINSAQAGAFGFGGPMADQSCSQLNSYGFTAGIIYCVQASIDNAVGTYYQEMQQNLQPYEFAAMMVAIALFGLKMMNSDMQDPLRETGTIILRILMGVFFYNEAGTIYTWVAGTSPSANDGVINEAIGWITGSGSGFGFGNTTSLFQVTAQNTCNSTTPPNTFSGYQIWQVVDCMFAKLMGAADPAQHPYEFATSLLVIVAAALFSATTGVIVAMLGLSLFIGALMLVFRAVYLVLMSYLCIGFVTVLGPLVAPLLFFESKYLTEKFKRWLGIIISCIFQPVFVIGFLAMAITVDDAIVEGDLSGCNPPTMPGSGASLAGSNVPAMGYGQDGTGVCSFTQLFNGSGAGNSPADANLVNWFANFWEQNQTKLNYTTVGDPQARSLDNNTFVNPGTPGSVSGNDVLSTQKTGQVIQANQASANAQNMGWSGATSNKQFTPMRQLILMLLTFIFATYAMRKLMDVVPQMAANMTIMAGLNLAGALKLPLEDAMNNALSGANSGARRAAAGKGLLSGNFGGPGAMASALLGGGAGAARSLSED